MRTERVEAPVPLAVDVAGNGPLVVFVHGLGGDRTTWHAQLALLSATHTAVAVDLRGYGHSADGPDPLDFKQDFCADLVAVMDHCGCSTRPPGGAVHGGAGGARHGFAGARPGGVAGAGQHQPWV